MKLFLTSLSLFFVSIVSAQWSQTGSNLYPTTSTNNVGIGTSSTTTLLEKLHVSGNIYSSGTQLKMPYGAFYSDVNNIAFFTDGGYIFSNRANNVTRANIATNGILSLYSNNSIKVSLSPVGSSYFIAGNVGIGTASPVGEFHVKSLSNNTDIVMETADGATKWDLAADQNLKRISFWNMITGKTPFAVSYAAPDWALFVAPSGNVLIGKDNQANSQYKLDVAGAVRADKVVVNTSGADFVFDSAYDLRPLSEVESYVRQNKHLPQIETAAEMQKSGVDLGSNQTKLLQKVEELTLYLIEQSKKVDELNETVNAQSHLIADQQKRIEMQQSQIADLQKSSGAAGKKDNRRK